MCERRGQRLRRSVWSAAAAASALAAIATLLQSPEPLLVWNASPSSPVGLYRVAAAGRLHKGDIVIAWPPPAARRLAAERHYLPRGVPLVKRVGGIAGDRVCAAGKAIAINGEKTALRRSRDPSRRPLPWWSGCHRLQSGDLFLLSAGTPQAFDGRYFGISRSSDIVGKATLLWRA
jgi:conjugative transfer signal peptidase TraF